MLAKGSQGARALEGRRAPPTSKRGARTDLDRVVGRQVVDEFAVFKVPLVAADGAIERAGGGVDLRIEHRELALTARAVDGVDVWLLVFGGLRRAASRRQASVRELARCVRACDAAERGCAPSCRA
eukprot:5120301-Prymnesium_polylepis.1